MRLESSVFISAPQATTPFHFEPEVNFFGQIEGEKIYHLYEPSVLAEDEVQPLYVAQRLISGRSTWRVGTPSAEHVFRLHPGAGLHQPQDAPHWVETVGSHSISYTLVYETREGRTRSRVRSFNAYLRRLPVDPARPGERPARDVIKATAMAAAIPVRRQIGKAVRSLPVAAERRKGFNLFRPEDREVTTEEEIECFDSIDTNAAIYKPELQHRAEVLTMEPGMGVHIPVDAPHWLSER